MKGRFERRCIFFSPSVTQGENCLVSVSPLYRAKHRYIEGAIRGDRRPRYQPPSQTLITTSRVLRLSPKTEKTGCNSRLDLVVDDETIYEASVFSCFLCSQFYCDLVESRQFFSYMFTTYTVDLAGGISTNAIWWRNERVLANKGMHPLPYCTAVDLSFLCCNMCLCCVCGYNGQYGVH